jgi:hypothetical protein
MEKKPADLAIWKKSVAIQFTLKAGEAVEIRGRNDKKYLGTSKGCVFVAIAAAISEGDKKYDWDHKMTIALSEHEVAQFILGMQGNEVNFVHDPNMGSQDKGQTIKSIKISKAPDKDFIYVNAQEKTKGEESPRKYPGVALTPAETLEIRLLLGAALPKILGW